MRLWMIARMTTQMNVLVITKVITKDEGVGITKVMEDIAVWGKLRQYPWYS